MASKCTKFLPNIFNKTKCQHCFAAKEAHSAEALENNKASRKVSKCGYLFVSPGYDFSNPVDRTRRWQRRLFRLYDDGELSYCVDENPDTVPQAVVDMNKCTDVQDAEAITSHQFSLSITTPEKTLYVKANSKEEILWWQDILGEFPKTLKAVKPRRKQPYLILSSKENQNGEAVDAAVGDNDFKQAQFDIRGRIDGPAYATFRGVRSLKHRYDSAYQDGLRKSSSLHDLSSEDKEMTLGLESSRFLSRSGDRLDSLNRVSTFSLSKVYPESQHQSLSINPTLATPRTTGQPAPQMFLTPKKQLSSLSSTSSTSSGTSGTGPVRGSYDEQLAASGSRSTTAKQSRERSSSLKDFSTAFSLPRNNDGTQPSLSADGIDSNVTDELKDLVYMKKGWLIKQAATEKDCRKHWFVLAGNSLRYYKDAQAEESNMLDGRIDLSSCYEVSEMPTHRNYGFKIKTGNGEYTLAAMTLGIRDNWMKAIRLCMELHSTIPKWKLSSSSVGASLSSKHSPKTSDDLEFQSGVVASSTTAVTGASGETAFQLVGHKDPHRRESQKPVRRHHSDVSPGNVSKVLSVKEFTASLEPAEDVLASSCSITHSSVTPSNLDRNDHTSRAPKIPRQHSPSKENLLWPSRLNSTGSRDATPKMRRFVEGSDSLPIGTSSGAAAQGPEQSKSTSKRNVASESTKEEVKKEMMRRAKSPSARVKEKSRPVKSPCMHSPITPVDDVFHYHLGSATASESDATDDAGYRDLPMSEDEFTTLEDTDHDDEVGSATASDIVGGDDDALVEILETEVETLKDRLEHTQTELDKMHKDNIDLKSRLHKESAQSLDSGYGAGSRWGSSQVSSPSDAAGAGRWNQGTAQSETLKRELKDARDTVQRQRLDIENLKGKLDMSMSKLTGTEKALSEALREYKQQKDKFVKLSSEWNRRIRTMESQSKDSNNKLERSRESLQAKERECRRLEVDVKSNLQRLREQERDILKLRAVEHEYNQLKERLDDRELELSNLKSELKEKEHLAKKIKDDYERQLEDLDRDFVQERDDMENQMEQLKSELYSVHDRQASMTDNMTSNLADMLKEKDDIIVQLEEKVIEADKRLVDLSNELHLEMGENADLAHTIKMLQNDKLQLTATIDELESQIKSLKTQVSGFETDNFNLHRQLEQLCTSNKHLHDSLNGAKRGKDVGAASAVSSDEELERLKKTIVDLNTHIKDLQMQLQNAEYGDDAKSNRDSSSLSSVSSLDGVCHHDLLHNVLVVDSHLKEINTMLHQLRQNFDLYIDSLDDDTRGRAIKLADLVEDIGQKCQDVQDSFDEYQEAMPPASEANYKHVITVSAMSSGKAIMQEYKGLKVKFDQVVTELRKVKKDLKDTCSSCDLLKQEDKRLQSILEGSYKQHMVELIARVDALSAKIVYTQTSSQQASQTAAPFPSNSAADVVREIEQQLSVLDKRLSSLEQQASSVQQASVISPGTEPGQSSMLTKLEEIKSQIEDTNSKLRNLSSSPLSPTVTSCSALQSQMNSYKERVGSIMAKLKLPVSTDPGNGCQEDADAPAAGFSSCLHEIRERVLEIGERLDSLEEDDEDSDSDDDGEQTTVEDIREKLAQLTEYIEQHCKLTSSDWTLLRLMTLQKACLKTDGDRNVSVGTDNDDEQQKLKIYADRLSLEAVLLSEMACVLQTKHYLQPDDTICREIDSLNSKVILLHQQLDNEIKTMHFEDPQADLLSSYAELMAEKILITGDLCSQTFDQKMHIANASSTTSLQPMLLATEALVRSQIDSYISSSMDKTADEILTLPTHLTARTVVQGELTYCLNQLKTRLENNPEILAFGPVNYEFMFNRLLERQAKVLATLECYSSQIIHSLAVIIFKESEEMTIVQGPESVLEAMCSELSTIIEKHIQHFKEKCRTATDTHSARKYDIIVNELRNCREAVLSNIKSQHEAYAKDPTSIRDSSLDIPVQSLDNTINKFGEILSLKSTVVATTHFLAELLKMGSAVLSDLELDQDSDSEIGAGLEKGLVNFVSALSEALQMEALSKENLARKVTSDNDNNKSCESVENIVLRVPDLSHYSQHLSPQAQVIVREAVLNAQLTFSLFKQKLVHECEIKRLRVRRPARTQPELNAEESRDSDDTLDLQTDFQALLLPLEEVLENKQEDELQVLQVVLGLVSQMKTSVSDGKGKDNSGLDDQLRQLEQKLQHEVELARQRHETHLEVFRQESGKLEKVLEEQQQDRDQFEDRCAQLEDELITLQLQHEEEKDRVKQDILTAVHAIRSNDEKSETHLTEKTTRLSRELVMQKLNFRKLLAAIRKDVSNKEKNAVVQSIDDHMKTISLSAEEEQDESYQPPLPNQPPPDMVDGKATSLVDHSMDKVQPAKTHMDQVEQLRKEKEEALAEEIRNTKAALDAVRAAYEEELSKEKAKYKDALLTMYTEEYVNEIRLRHQEDEERMAEELQKLNMHYTSKCEDYKLLEMKLHQTKQDYESHINQLSTSNDHLEEMLNREIDQLKDFIKTKPSSASLITGSATMEEELYDAKIMVRVKDAELQKLRSQVKNLENSLHRTTEEQRQTMTQYMQCMKTSSEMKKQFQEEVSQLTEKLNKVLGSQGLKANIKRTPSFHQRARSPSPQSSSSSKRESDHSSRDSHRRRHIHPKDLRRSKSSPSLPYVFDGKSPASKLGPAKPGRRSRSPKS